MGGIKHLNEESQQIEENLEKQTKEYKLEQINLSNKKAGILIIFWESDFFILCYLIRID